MSTILEQICVNTFTVTDLHRRLGLLQECLEEVLYHRKDSMNEDTASAVVTYARTVGQGVDVEAFEQWGDEVWNTFQAHNIVDQILKLKQESEALPVLTLYAPVDFDSASTRLIGEWVKTTINNRMLLDIHQDPNVVGGCAFVFNDAYHDFSVHAAVKKQKGLVTQLLTSYVRNT